MAVSILKENLVVLWSQELSPPKAQLTCEQGVVCFINVQAQRQVSVRFLTLVAENDDEGWNEN